MEALAAFKKAKDKYDRASRFISLIGKSGHISGKLSHLTFDTKVFYQNRPGENGYYDMSEMPEFKKALEEVIEAKFGGIAAEALAKMKAECEKTRAAAEQEYKSCFDKLIDEAA